jgi:hypothetical protein
MLIEAVNELLLHSIYAPTCCSIWGRKGWGSTACETPNCLADSVSDAKKMPGRVHVL